LEQGIEIIIVEENGSLRERLSNLISSMSHVSGVTQLSHCQWLVDTVSRVKPQYVLVDMKLALESKNALTAIRSMSPDTTIIALTENDTEMFERVGLSSMINVDRLVKKKRLADGISSFTRDVLRISPDEPGEN
jgi:AmiR/NasT family two-component response regulator